MSAMTEQEAKTKWCPHARVRSSHVQGGSFNREADKSNLHSSKCIASGCMAWRWDASMAMSGAAAPKQGFCGLAGKP